VTSVLVTGGDGFIGKNLRVAWQRAPAVRLTTFGSSDAIGSLEALVRDADVIYHLAGVNRPAQVEAFEQVNAGLTRRLADAASSSGRRPLIVFASTTQAALDTPYGRSKRMAEDALRDLAARGAARVRVFRLPGVFGKWCRPNYNSVVATFCYNAARGIPLSVRDPQHELALVYIDDVIAAFAAQLELGGPEPYATLEVEPVYRITLGALAERIGGFQASRPSLFVPDMSDALTKRLHATYLSYLDPQTLAQAPELRTDARGTLVELLKSTHGGQIFVSTTRPGVTRGNHYHDTKVERFCVLQGEAVIQLRHVLEAVIVSYPVSGRRIQIVDIPPGYTHSIRNVGDDDMVVLFWSSEPFDAGRPDTFPLEVVHAQT
jgi:UDP-2-acetamido-2,6-beta-L-arabino-hexul-4-ose reductase